MLVAIDIGNTNITMGLMDGDQLVGRYRLTTKARRIWFDAANLYQPRKHF